jgi:hypothetical protein
VGGWSEKICGDAIDERRNDIIYCAKNARKAIELLNSKMVIFNTVRWMIFWLIYAKSSKNCKINLFLDMKLTWCLFFRTPYMLKYTSRIMKFTKY